METVRVQLFLGLALAALFCGDGANAIIPATTLPLPAPPTTAVADPRCYLPPNYGECTGYFIRYYIDMSTNPPTCRQFVYSGCMGNMNNFADGAQCQYWGNLRCLSANPLLRNVVVNPLSSLKVLG